MQFCVSKRNIFTQLVPTCFDSSWGLGFDMYVKIYCIFWKLCSKSIHFNIKFWFCRKFRKQVSDLFFNQRLSNRVRILLFVCEYKILETIVFTWACIDSWTSDSSLPKTQTVSTNSVSTNHFVWTTTPLRGHTSASSVSTVWHEPYWQKCTLLHVHHP